MNEKAKAFVEAIGAVAEACGVMRDELIKNGFTRAEALRLVNTYLAVTLTPKDNKEEK